MQVLEGIIDNHSPDIDRNLVFRFLLNPKELVGDSSGRVQKLLCTRTKLEGRSFEQRAIIDAEAGVVEIPAQLVFKSIGYMAEQFDEEVPFDTKKAVVPSEEGRVVRNGKPEEGLYVAGWLKRGPTGIIGTNIADAAETVSSIKEDWAEGKLKQFDEAEFDPRGAEFLSKQNYVTFDGWKKIDDEEKRLGELQGKPREKFVHIKNMLDIASS
jgi:NADPH-dependent glutamate synthase beta subunit-like oxidoreductase